MIELLHEKKRILNLDETWIGQTNFSRYKWQAKENQMSETIDPVMPRISMIAGLDNHGDLYVSLLQSNVDQDTYSLFLRHLVEQLDEDRPQWRADTVILIDGAKYHTTPKVKATIRKLMIPTIVSAPYSYDGAPIETFFSLFKRGNINIQRLAVTKSKFHCYLTLA